MSRAVIFGGAGYIGTMLARHFVEAERFQEVLVADIKPPASEVAGVRFVQCDVREAITIAAGETAPDWIFNFAAVHREPGHEAHEYFDTNLAGARNVCAWAEQVGCANVFFTSSIATYGPTNGATTSGIAGAAQICQQAMCRDRQVSSVATLARPGAGV